jgi:hypothetical protein
MAYIAPLLTRRAVVLAKLETTYNQDAVPSPTADGVLERDFTRGDLSQMPHIVGRKLAKMSFTTELRSNGKATGLAADAPVIARLFSACGYTMNSYATASITQVFDQGDQPTVVTWAPGAAPTNTELIAYYLQVIVGGASGTATVSVTSDTIGETSAAVAITSGTPFVVGTKGVMITPTWTGALVSGQRWMLWALPKCNVMSPVSDNFQSLTQYTYLDGLLHKLTGALGTFTIDATAGQYGKIKWEYTGQYNAVTDTPLVSPIFERTLPAQIELARLNIEGYSAVVNALTFTQGNTIVPRPDMNSSDGYQGVRLTARKPEYGIDPEASLVATHDFWGRMAAARRMPFQWRAGTTTGNTVWSLSPNTQYSKMTYKDRTGIRVFDAGLKVARSNGDDEQFFVFC